MQVNPILRQRIAVFLIIVCSAFAAHISYRYFKPQWVEYRKGDNLYNQQDWAAAISSLEKSFAMGATDKNISAKIAHAYGKLKDYPKAIYWYQKFLEQNPKAIWAHKALAGMLTANGEFDKASEEYKLILEMEREPHEN